MKHLTLSSIAILSLSLAACAKQPGTNQFENPAQMATINLWHQCIDSNLQNLTSSSASDNPNLTIQHALIVCQGHREDVLATFSQHLEPALDKLMIEQTYEAGYNLYAAEHGLPLPITSVTYDTLRRQKLQP